MTQRERYLATFDFQPVDKPFIRAVGGWAETMERWQGEGWDGRAIHEIFDTDLVLHTAVYYGPVPRYEYEVLEETDDTLVFNVSRCKYAEVYEKDDMQDLGLCLSCNRDFPFTKGFNPDFKLIRSKTIMEGADVCDFRFVKES